MRAIRMSFGFSLCSASLLVIVLTPRDVVFAGTRPSKQNPVRAGRELFQRQWIPNDARSHGGDGLGPVFNARSCAECHHQGGPGGGGSNVHDVEIAAPVATGDPNALTRPTRGELASLVSKTGILTTGSFVLHRSGTDASYEAWRKEITKKRFDGFTIETTSRNTPALFGASLIDAIPDRILKDAEMRAYPNFPKVHGRLNHLIDGRIGRFGWKAQTATLRDFVLTACSVELGLEVPGHSQATDPRSPDRPPTGLDMNQAECDALVAFVRSLPPPARAFPSTPEEDEGALIFQTIGCATCHTPTLGNVVGLFSDLLLHDLGPEVNDDVGRLGYPGSPPSPSDSSRDSSEFASGEGPGGPKSQEWRTPPLWGLRRSAPFMHDGKSWRLSEVLRRHGGEATDSAQRYNQLNGIRKRQLQAFLLSLELPPGLPKIKVAPAHKKPGRWQGFGPETFALPLPPPPRQCYGLGGFGFL